MTNKKLFLIYCILAIQVNLNAQTEIVFRYDDYALKTNNLHEQVIGLFQKHHIPLVLGVIPCDANERVISEADFSFLPVLKKGINEETVEIALHGLNHKKIIEGEFGKLPYPEQLRRISKGKLVLDSILNCKIVTFIPPWNTYDDITLEALHQTGFQTISSALCVGQSFSNPYLNYYPETLEDFDHINTVLDQNKNRKGIIVLMFHAYSFTNKFTLHNLDQLLGTLKSRKNIQFVTFNQLTKLKEKSDRARMDANKVTHLLTKKFHTNGVIQTTQFAILLRVLNLAFYLLSFFIVIFIGFSITLRKKMFSVKFRYLLLSVFAVAISCMVWVHVLSPLKLYFFTIISAFIFVAISKFQLKK